MKNTDHILKEASVLSPFHTDALKLAGQHRDLAAETQRDNL